ncbi:hypothetical protein KKB71_01105 [Patescibacteria group bacterium]|nr:hypothetical protein [Patescibacteria group bacterium]MBU2219509.1 hypothetical protein [Patescibacteria group bacterium]MBU2263155.1 hypothetical protein [Patescibacteria group bacterium]
MRNFKQDRGKSFGGSRGGGFGRRDRGRDRGPVTMHQAVCDQCGKSCEVPFKPTSGKPVYCNVCFGGKKETGNYRGGDRFPQKSFDSYKAPVKTDNDEIKKQFDMLNVKLDRIIKSLEEKKEEKNKTAVKKTVKTKKAKKK